MKKPIQFGKYWLLDRINVGGMAEVFKAKAFGVEGFERLLAVKRILPNIAEDEEFITMFIDEAKAGWRYRLTVRPWTHFLDANIEYRIYQEKTAKDKGELVTKDNFIK